MSKENVIARTGGKRMTSSLTAEYGAGAELKYTAELAGFAGQNPYFSVTAEVSTAASRRRNDIEAGGCIHDLVLKHFPEVAPVVALHLSDMDGVPMHAAANALYWAGGIINLGQRYHGGNSNPAKSCDDCARILGEHLRITTDEARALAVAAAHHCPQEWREEYGARLAAQYIADFCEAQRPRWKAEADAALAWIKGRPGAYVAADYATA